MHVLGVHVLTEQAGILHQAAAHKLVELCSYRQQGRYAAVQPGPHVQSLLLAQGGVTCECSAAAFAAPRCCCCCCCCFTARCAKRSANGSWRREVNMVCVPCMGRGTAECVREDDEPPQTGCAQRAAAPKTHLQSATPDVLTFAINSPVASSLRQTSTVANDWPARTTCTQGPVGHGGLCA